MTLQQNVLNHWDRMIKWASKQPKTKRCFDNMGFDIGKDLMRKEIREDWKASSCAWCKSYTNEILLENKCLRCPLYIKHGKCETSKRGNFWQSVNLSRTWGTWTKNARLFRKQIKEVK